MKTAIFFLFPVLLILAGRELTAQNNPEKLQEIAAKYYQLGAPKISENGRWFTIRKIYDTNRDTILILRSKHPEKPESYRIKTGATFFTGENGLLMETPNHVELLNLKEQTSIYYKNVKSIKALEKQELFILHYNETANSKLEIRNSSGSLVCEQNRVSRFFTTEMGHVYVIVKDPESKFKVVFLNGQNKEKLYESSRKINYLNIDPDEQGIIVYEQSKDSTSPDIRYLNIEGATEYSLKEVLSAPFEKGKHEIVKEGSAYFLRLWAHPKKEHSSPVNIWYGNDNRLEQKFYQLERETCYLWEPKKKQIQRIGTDILTRNANIGNTRYFLCFNPYLLQDYTKTTPFELNIYDRMNDCYSQMDTIAQEIHISPNSQYILFPKDKTWYIYYLATRTKKSIDGNNMLDLLFTPDGKTVLFTGASGLWCYDVKSAYLSKLDHFEGFQVTILNATSKHIPGGSKFYQKTVDPGEPLVVKLYNSRENESKYVLWEKGIYKTIIPLTSKCIQNLVYNRACTHFCYTEEDYNLPPRLIYKEMGKKEKVIYESNKADKAVLSLKQEIIPYTNSDRISLKGVLFYPLNYDPLKKYPMVVHIYQEQSKKVQNKYTLATYSQPNSDGFNLRLLLEKGYFVYFPDIVYGEKGTGLSALNCVNQALDAIANNTTVDKSKTGLIGHSHGGYQANFIATHSNRFAAYVSGAGNSDIIRSYFSFNYNFLRPFYFQYESGQYEMQKSFSEDKELYFRNNPIYSTDQVNAPVLLWTGMKDQNIDWDQTMEFYIGLKRNNKRVIALFYPNEAHTLYASDACHDLGFRILDWFDYFLKGEMNIEWISKSIKKGDER